MKKRTKEIPVKSLKYHQAIFAMGCFWSPDLIFSKISGIISTVAGYTGGKDEYKSPTYEQVCSGRTGHAEAVQITFDQGKISYKKLLDLFWKNHNPTTINRQGPDIGSQYRSAIFYIDEEQKSEALESKKEFQKTLDKPIVTEIVKAKEFYPAEEYHQSYLKKHGKESCHINY